MKLKDKVAIVTGSSRGIGKGIALQFAREGARVVVAARTETPTEKLPGDIYQTAEEIKALGGEALPIRCNVIDEASVGQMVETTIKKFGRINILVNNAGVGLYLPFIETSSKVWDLVIGVNLRGTFLCTKYVVPRMIEQKSGSIINISSTAAEMMFSLTAAKEQKEPTRNGLAYGVSKTAIERFTIGLSIELGEYNIAVNALKPGRPVATEGLKAWRKDADWSGWVGPEHMARAATYLAMQDASGTTGTVNTDIELLMRHGLY